MQHTTTTTHTTTPAQKIPTTERVIVENYPYGFKLRTTLFDYIEFDRKKGFRHCTQTINPKTNRPNNPKKSTYYNLMTRYYDEKGHIKTITHDFNGDESINRGCKFVYENFDLYTPEMIEYIYILILSSIKVTIKAQIIYCGSNFEELKPLFEPAINTITKALKEKTNEFDKIILPIEEINAKKVPNYNPFTSQI
jgi:hypothetical protein